MQMIRVFLLGLGLLLVPGFGMGQEQMTKAPPVDISGQMFLAYQLRESEDSWSNDFTLKRGYLNINRDFNKIFSVRFTQDITLDKEGSDAGNIEMRLKFLYLKVNLGFMPKLDNAWIEAGMVHRPWLDFEEKINDFRVQGPLNLEAMEVVNSADFGINFVTLLGGPLDYSNQKKIGKGYPGRYGSLSIGIFNGGGYYAIEENRNKTFESRLTLRPLSGFLPGLQASYHFIAGQGNKPEAPPFILNHLGLSYESARFIMMAQYFRGTGNMWGTFINQDNESLNHQGMAIFGELFLYRDIVSIFGEFRHFELNTDGPGLTRKYMGGISYHFLSRQKILFDYEYFSSPAGKRVMYEFAMEIRF